MSAMQWFGVLLIVAGLAKLAMEPMVVSYFMRRRA